MYEFLQNITIKAASIVELLDFSGSLPMFFFCYILSNNIQANKDVLFCSYRFLYAPKDVSAREFGATLGACFQENLTIEFEIEKEKH